MYTVIVGTDGSMVASVVEVITQNSNLAHTLRILAPTEYCGYDVREFMAVLEYKTPESGSVATETLTASAEEYKGYIEYLLPVKKSMTAESGIIVFCVTFLQNAEEKDQAIVLKTQPADIMIAETDGWSGDLPDDTLNAIDEKMLELQEMQGELRDMQEDLDNSKADSLIYDDHKLQLTANGNPIGESVVVTGGEGSLVWKDV